jgi:hypothetical protein
MKQLFKPLAVLFCLASVFSCSKKTNDVIADVAIVNPISDYTITPDPADGFTFKYTNLSKNYTKLEWRFGDDTLKTDANPTHVFLSTGKFTTDLKTFSSTGNVSHKYVDINIAPDDILQISTAKTSVLYQLKFTATVKANIASILWTWNDVSPTGTTTTTTSTDISPLKTFGIGTFNSFTCKVTTDKGSVVSITRNVTTEGIATDITQSRIGYQYTLDNTGNTNENAPKLVDGNPNTKFGYYSAFPQPLIITLQFPAPVVVKLYAIENGNDSESTRDPKEWVIEASNDGATWTQIDHVTRTVGFADELRALGQTSTRYLRFFYFPIANPAAYTYYRWRIISLFASAFQIEEFRLYR